MTAIVPHELAVDRPTPAEIFEAMAECEDVAQKIGDPVKPWHISRSQARLALNRCDAEALNKWLAVTAVYINAARHMKEQQS